MWRGLAAGTAVGAGFVHWLVHQSLYDIGALCPYCLVVWAVTIPVAVWTVLHVLRPAESSVVALLWSWRAPWPPRGSAVTERSTVR